jgi:DNA-binding response OmpR family regulator
MICDALRAQGYEVIRASGGLQALRTAAAQASEVHLLLTDVVLPGLYGWELAELMKLDWPRLKVLYVSSRLDRDTLELAQSHFVILMKPFDSGALARCVGAALRIPSVDMSPDELFLRK